MRKTRAAIDADRLGYAQTVPGGRNTCRSIDLTWLTPFTVYAKVAWFPLAKVNVAVPTAVRVTSVRLTLRLFASFCSSPIHASEHRLATLSLCRHGTIIRPFVSEQGRSMKRRKWMPFPNTRSLFALSAAGRAVVSIAENTIAPLVNRFGKTVARNRNARVSTSMSAMATSRQRQVPASDEVKRQQAQDEQDMFDAQMMSVPIESGSHQQTAATMRDSAQGDRE